ncbi:hypothetical protein EDD17DRAFT_1630895 [Pisolithus thermaeus]|nr:hypothetical protein EDD17DRAFT_1630895 [Pisolithus thermaeus]
MELELEDNIQVDLKKLEGALLSWFPNYSYLHSSCWWYDSMYWPEFEVDADVSVPPLPKDDTSLEEFPPVQLVAEHAIGCLLVAEHSYFLMQHGHHVWREVLSLAVEEYKTSNKQTTISTAVRRVFHEHGSNMDSLCEAIINIIIDNRMSNKLLMKAGSK